MYLNVSYKHCANKNKNDNNYSVNSLIFIISTEKKYRSTFITEYVVMMEDGCCYIRSIRLFGICQ